MQSVWSAPRRSACGCRKYTPSPSCSPVRFQNCVGSSHCVARSPCSATSGAWTTPICSHSPFCLVSNLAGCRIWKACHSGCGATQLSWKVAPVPQAIRDVCRARSKHEDEYALPLVHFEFWEAYFGAWAATAKDVGGSFADYSVL